MHQSENLYGIKTAGHAHERSTTFFSLMYKHDVYLTPEWDNPIIYSETTNYLFDDFDYLP